MKIAPTRVSSCSGLLTLALALGACEDGPASRAADAPDAGDTGASDVQVETPSPIGRWSPAGRLALARVGHSATRLADDHILVVGGAAGLCPGDTGAALASVERLAPDGAVDEAAPLADARMFHGAALLRTGGVLVAGGQRGGDALASAELYDPATDAWRTIAPLGAPQIRTTLAAHGARGAVSVGYDGAIELLADDADVWRPAPVVPGALGAPLPIALPDGRVALVGCSAAGVLSADGASLETLRLPYLEGDCGAAMSGDGLLLVGLAPTSELTEAGPVHDALAFLWDGEAGGDDAWEPLGAAGLGQVAYELVAAPNGAVFARSGWGARQRFEAGVWRELAASDAFLEGPFVPLSDGTARVVAGTHGQPTCAASSEVRSWSP